jgi:hypothetical protein
MPWWGMGMQNIGASPAPQPLGSINAPQLALPDVSSAQCLLIGAGPSTYLHPSHPLSFALASRLACCCRVRSHSNGRLNHHPLCFSPPYCALSSLLWLHLDAHSHDRERSGPGKNVNGSWEIVEPAVEPKTTNTLRVCENLDHAPSSHGRCSPLNHSGANGVNRRVSTVASSHHYAILCTSYLVP